MVLVTVYRRRERVTGFVVTGHAGTGPAGEDLVCAAVSAIVQTALLGIEQISGGPAADTLDPGLVRWRGGESGDGRKQQTIVDTMLLGIAAISRDYPQAVRVQEVQLSRSAAAARARPSRRQPIQRRRPPAAGRRDFAGGPCSR